MCEIIKKVWGWPKLPWFLFIFAYFPQDQNLLFYGSAAFPEYPPAWS
ncbi:hypothetical protein HOLDEFILI_03412 [Holdemania filiformis DSM 12042]|uniref:Uncharacterized protein n=1 Tax=Holdemania filiformis DSM 12042 TaxID=545696 RepID=B9YC53_9FIRM|nr:hypothetical protein HOLDEFILI_03412 [Holdemania filiformis DSM 12042]